MKGGKNTNASYPETATKRDLAQKFEDQLVVYHAICPDGSEEDASFKKGPVPKVNVYSDKRQGNKCVTCLIGVEDYGLNATDMAKILQKRFAASTTTQESNIKHDKHRIVVIQGDHVRELGDELSNSFGIPPHLVDIKLTQKKGKKKK